MNGRGPDRGAAGRGPDRGAAAAGPDRGAAGGTLFPTDPNGAAEPPPERSHTGEVGVPLAARMRPRSVEDLVGQEHLLGPGSVLRAMVDGSQLHSLVLWGPAGSGKTTVAHLIARAAGAAVTELSAVSSGVAEVRRVIEEGRGRLAASGRRTILFIDEVHRFSRTQQDALLPGAEAGWVVFIGATTENPFTSLTTPLLSRALLLRLERLSGPAIRTLLETALADADRGLAGRVTAEPGALDAIENRSEGDARVALNALEAAAALAAGREGSVITRADALEAIRQRFLRYDRAGDRHYDVASAFIKSLRGSDPDAALAWLARMIRGGEDPRFIARRMVIFAAEDVGLADPEALQVAVAASHGSEMVGMPEARLLLAEAAVYLALAPKSNAVIRAVDAALADLDESGQGEVPLHLRSSGAPGGRTLGYGSGYKYPHDYAGGQVEQAYGPVAPEPPGRGAEPPGRAPEPPGRGAEPPGGGSEGPRYWRPEADLDQRRGRARRSEGEG